MLADQEDFKGCVFHKSIDGGRASADIDLQASSLVALTSTDQRFELPYSACELSQGGASGRMIFCRTADKSLTIFCEEKHFAAALAHAAGGQLDEQLQVAKQSLGKVNAASKRMMWGIILAVVLLLVTAYYALIYAGQAAVSALPISIDEQIGDMAYKQVDLGGPKVKDQDIVEPIQALLERLKQAKPDDPFNYKLDVIESDTVNAFALPGGQMVILTGLLDAADSPAQVAGVIAHEMAHISERHGLQGIARSVGFIVAIDLLIGDAGGLIVLGAEIAQFAAQNSYSREHEAEADFVGVERLYQASIDPASLAEFFKILEKETADMPDIPEWMSTHPEHAERIKAIKEQVRAFSPKTYTAAISDEDWRRLKAALAKRAGVETTIEESSDGRNDQ